jgi:hypothetical protein
VLQPIDDEQYDDEQYDDEQEEDKQDDDELIITSRDSRYPVCLIMIMECCWLLASQ